MKLPVFLSKKRKPFSKSARLALMLIAAAVHISCDRDACEHPFIPAATTFKEKPTDHASDGNFLGLSVGLQTNHSAILDRVEVEIIFPPEVKITNAVDTDKENSSIETINNKVVWHPNKFPSNTNKQVYISIASRSGWKHWSVPIRTELDVRFRNTWGGKCRNWPDGRYHMTFYLGHDGYSEREWHQVAAEDVK